MTIAYSYDTVWLHRETGTRYFLRAGRDLPDSRLWIFAGKTNALQWALEVRDGIIEGNREEATNILGRRL